AHERAVAEMAAAREAAARELERLEAARASAEADVEEAVARHDEATAATRARLEKSDAYAREANALEDLTAMAARAEQKLAVAEEDRAKKGAAYESDPLFKYLFDRKFGTRDYRAFPLFALLDNWVASLIKYRDHRLNYERLLEIPVRFADHVAQLNAQAEAARGAIEGMEREALERDGVGKLRDAVGAARARVETLDGRIAEAEATHKDLAERHAAAAAGEAGPIDEARKLLADALSRIAVPDLKVVAAETASLEDDRLIDALVVARRERMEFEETRKRAIGSLQGLGRRLTELEDMRRRFKSARYDSPYSEFSGKDALAIMLAEFLRGALDKNDLWKRIERGHRTRRRDWDNDFGGDEWRDMFGLPDNWGGRMGGSWGDEWSERARRGGPVIPRTPGELRLPRPPRPPRMPRLPSGGGRRGGGFRTGGGF
ncbi:MAG: hypothetical protein HXY21_01325, partial [Parvularculaceae bacterium]|nr:hypothetical protein [Parvularculaceae bacterium]